MRSAADSRRFALGLGQSAPRPDDCSDEDSDNSLVDCRRVDADLFVVGAESQAADDVAAAAAITTVTA